MKEGSVRSSVVSMLLLVLASAGVLAQRSLTLDEVIDLTLKNNKEVIAARIGIEKADAQVAEAIGTALPSLNFSATYQRNLQLPVFFIPNFQDPDAGLQAIRAGLSNQYNVGFQASQILFNSAIFTGIGASKIYQQAAKEQANAVIAKVVTDTRKAFYGTLLARDFAAIANASLTNGEQNLANIRLLFSEGLVAEFDAIRAEVGVENIRPMVTQAEAGYRNAVSALQTQMGIGLSEQIEPVGTFDPNVGELPAEDEAILRAMKQNFDIRALELQEEVAYELIAINRSDYYPTVSLFGNWVNQGQSSEFSNFLSASSSSVGVNLSINLFNGLRSQARVEQSQADRTTVSIMVAQARDGIKLQIRSVLNSLRSAKQRIAAQQRTVEQAQRGYDISQIRYREGTGSLLEINDADFGLSQARTNKVQALHDFYSAKADLDRLMAVFEQRFFVNKDGQ